MHKKQDRFPDTEVFFPRHKLECVGNIKGSYIDDPLERKSFSLNILQKK